MNGETVMQNAKYDSKQVWEWDRDHWIHHWTDFSVFKEKGSTVICEGDGPYIYDGEGKRLPLDIAVTPNYEPRTQPVDVTVGAT